jgi:photosystem II stability/assembly factor-like uncharacterized protein
MNLAAIARALLAVALVVTVGCGSTAATAGAKTVVPAGFEPVSFTAVSERDFWLLGTASCPRGRCTAIVRTTDGGRTFAALHAPKLPRSGTTPELRFADRLDGFIFIPWSGLFYATHDGGASWERLALGRVLGFATGAGTVYVATSRSLEFARVSANAWHSRPLPFASDGSPLALVAHGASLWLLGSRPSAGPSATDELARSNDAGRTFVSGVGPCVPGLGGELAPTSTRVVWAVCPTGMLGGAWRSTNGGVSFARLRTPQLVNAAQVAPASESTAVLERGVGARLLRTTDGGKTWRVTKTPGRGADVIWVGFTDARVGAALVQTRTEATMLWRTADGGASWSTVRIG